MNFIFLLQLVAYRTFQAVVDCLHFSPSLRQVLYCNILIYGMLYFLNLKPYIYCIPLYFALCIVLTIILTFPLL